MNRHCWCVAVVSLALTAGAAQQRLLTWSASTMGTTYTVKIAGVPPDKSLLAELRTAVENRLEEINRQMSHYRPDSELSRFNRSPSTAPFPVSSELAQVVRHAVDWARQSEGAFDPTILPLLQLWGFGPGGRRGRLPADEEIAAARRRCGYRHLRVTAADELQKDIPDLQLDLGAIGKGYAADQIARLLRARGYTNLFVSVSGEIVALGSNAEGRPWRIGIERPEYDPRRSRRLSAVIELSGRAVSTSGGTHQFFRDDAGRIHPHILDPRTGRPVQHRLASVTVVAPEALTADAVATILFVLGLNDGLRWLEERPQLAALFLVPSGADQFELVPSPRFPPFRRLQTGIPGGK